MKGDSIFKENTGQNKQYANIPVPNSSFASILAKKKRISVYNWFKWKSTQVNFLDKFMETQIENENEMKLRL